MSNSQTGQSAQVESTVSRFENAWRAGQTPCIDEFLPGPEREDDRILAELVFTDLEYRIKAGESILVESYFERFPQLINDLTLVLDLIEKEYQLRKRREADIGVNEYLNRFPQYREALFLRLSPARQMTLRLGTALAVASDRPPEIPGYEVLGILGQGGMGIVYKARQEKLQRFVALKMIVGGNRTVPELVGRFLGEAQAVARLQHPNIVQIFEAGEHQGQPYISLEFVDGTSLDKKVSGQPLPPQAAAELLLPLAQAIEAAHRRGIVHRDLKPANVLLTAEGTPKVTDFGLAKYLDDDVTRTQTGVILGTPSYMAPEQAEGRVKEIGPTADVYALGAILYEMLTGRPPFRGTTSLETLEQVRSQEPVRPSSLQPKIPRDLETICLKCLQKDAQRRYASAAELAEDLMRFLAGEPIQARPVSEWVSFWRWYRRNPAQAWTSVVAAGAIGMVITFVIMFATGLGPGNREAEAYRQRVADLERRALESPSNKEVPPPPNEKPAQQPPPDEKPPTARSQSWAQLFNGKDLTGWKTHPDQPGGWTVENGILVGRADPSQSHHLFSERGDYENFHLRAEARINDQGNSGVYFRSNYAVDRGQGKFPTGYEAQILLSHPNPALGLTGSLNTPGGINQLIRKPLVAANEWFTLEVIASGNHVVIKVNGTTTVDRRDPIRFRKGYLVLQAVSVSSTTVVAFRRIEIKEQRAPLERESRPRELPAKVVVPAPTDAETVLRWVEAITLDKSKKVCSRWVTKPRLSIFGATSEQSRVLAESVDHVNEALAETPFQIQLIEENNLKTDICIHFTPVTEMAKVAEKHGFRYVGSDKDYFWIFWNGRREINRGVILLAPDLEGRELWHSSVAMLCRVLGVRNQSKELPDSIFSGSRNIQQLSPADKKLLVFLYNHVQPRDGEEQLRTAFWTHWPIDTKPAGNTARPDDKPKRKNVILFDGTSLAGWVRRDGKPADWKMVDGYMEAGQTDIMTRQKFDDCQLHVEFWVPSLPNKTGQRRGNSGVFLQGRYEVQILDSYGIDPPKAGDCGALFARIAPSQNACKPPEEWQTFDITFRAPRPAQDAVKPGEITVVQNGITVIDKGRFNTPTSSTALDSNQGTPGPIMLQSLYGNKVRFRNIYLTPLAE